MGKILTAIALLLGLGIGVTACSDQRRLDTLSEGDELIMITRNSPTTYYFDGDQATGFEYELVKAFADSKGLRLRVKVAFTLEELIQLLVDGEGHIAAAGLTVTPDRTQLFSVTDPYIAQKPLIIYKSGSRRPRQLEDLANQDIVTLAGSSHVEALTDLATRVEGLTWREIRAADTLELMQQVTEEKADLAVIDSVEFRMQQRLYPRLVAALELEGDEDIAWYLPNLPGASVLTDEINEFFSQQRQTGQLAKLKERHFGALAFASRMSSFTFQRKVQSALPQWQALIEEVAAEYQMDWRLLAAIAYQESHWNPRATSPTGVRGMMMITRATAGELGITDRLDPRQSLRGGARFLKNLLRRLPNDIAEPDRTWMAMAAYNIGMGHLEDARKLTDRKGLDPHLWRDVREHLPLLQNPDIYPTTRFGFARGEEAVTYVDNIRHYYSVLQLQSLPENRIQPPIDTAALVSRELQDVLPMAL